MTSNQIAYQQLQEEKRAARVKERETERANKAKEAENRRSNLEKERLNALIEDRVQTKRQHDMDWRETENIVAQINEIGRALRGSGTVLGTIFKGGKK